MIGIAFIAFGILFSVIGLIILFVSVRQRAGMRDSREIAARIVDFEKRHHRNRGTLEAWVILYAPVYEYTEFGDIKRYTSNVSSTDPDPIGTEVTLYLSKSGKIYEKKGAALLIILGAAFMAFGIFFTVLGVILKRTLFL